MGSDKTGSYVLAFILPAMEECKKFDGASPLGPESIIADT